ncbi:MAG TPA: hypothetical protein VGI24_00870 [Solirubrobacteraceae bacterium]|jgi:hypothetical protein
MTQLSRPFQIALVTLALFVLVWFAALRRHTSESGGGSGSTPASSSAPATPSAAAQAKAAAAPTHIYHGAAPGVQGLTRAIDKAHGAVAQSQHEAHRVETSEPSAASGSSASAAKSSTADSSRSASGARSGHASTSATHTSVHRVVTTPKTQVHAKTPAVKPAAAKASMQSTVEHELQRGKTVLILFWNPHGSDDMAVHSALPAVQRGQGAKVAVHYASAGQVGEFGTVTHAVQVTQTPTLLIVNPHGQTTVLTGLTDAFAIQQAVAESRHS